MRKRRVKKNDDGEPPTEVLSQEEIDQLLTAINGDSDDLSDSFGTMPTNQSRYAGHYHYKNPWENESVKYKIYDFKRPDMKYSHFTKMSIASDYFVREVSSEKNKQIKSQYGIHIHTASVDTLTCEEVVRSVPTPSALMMFDIYDGDDLIGSGFSEVDPAISMALVHYTFGGHPGNFNTQIGIGADGFTHIERYIIENFIKTLLDKMIIQFNKLDDSYNLEYKNLVFFDYPPDIYNKIDMRSMTLLTTIETKLENVEGMCNICLSKSLVDWIFKEKKIEEPKNKIILPKTTEIPCRIRAGYTIMKYKDLYKKFDEGSNQTFDSSLIFLETDYGNGICSLTPQKGGVKRTFKYRGKETYKMAAKDHKRAIGLDNMNVTICVELGRATLTIDELNKIGEGSLIGTDKLAGEPVDVFANNSLIARGEVLVGDEYFTVRITERLDMGELPE